MSELRMQITETNYLLDGERVSGEELLLANDFEEEDLAEIASIPPGGSICLGGGAAPTFVLERTHEQCTRCGGEGEIADSTVKDGGTRLCPGQ